MSLARRLVLFDKFGPQPLNCLLWKKPSYEISHTELNTSGTGLALEIYAKANFCLILLARSTIKSVCEKGEVYGE